MDSRLLPALALLLIWTSAGSAGSKIAGPIEVWPVRIIDGDTFVGDALVWPGHVVRVAVRLRGIDAPEMRSRCTTEKRHAKVAQKALEEIVGNGPVWLSSIAGGKYFGRVIADAADRNGKDIASTLLDQRLVRAYSGGPRKSVC